MGQISARENGLRLRAQSDGRTTQRDRDVVSVICVYNEAGNVVETQEQVDDFQTSPPASRATRSGLTLLDILGYKTKLADISYAKTTLNARKSLMT